MPKLALDPKSLGCLVVASPALLVGVLGLPSLFGRPLTERRAAQAVYFATTVAFLAALGVFISMLWFDTRHVVISIGEWVHIGREDAPTHYHFRVKFVFDRLSVPFAALSLALCGTIAAFARRYLHREPGYNRFFVMFSFFTAGMVTAALAGTIETLFFGWELVGLSSALLVGFFHDRPAPVRNGFRVWSVYRFSDAALLLAAAVLHHATGEGDFDAALGAGPWPEGSASLASSQVLLVGGLLLVAAAGKSALVPFSGWLPRAMEGPTPSSAVFYGALSVHLGAYLLLRASPLLDASPLLSAGVVLLGLATAAFASVATRVQTDIKSILSFASLTQVGLIVVEIGLGWRYIPLAHLIGHACMRTLQFVRAPSVLRDRQALENALGTRIEPTGNRRFADWLYRFGLERGYLDAMLDQWIARPFLRLFQKLDAFEKRVTRAIAGRPDGEEEPRP
jgi:NAD(P)H-quinone oxidoreductase subunit 5